MSNMETLIIVYLAVIIGGALLEFVASHVGEQRSLRGLIRIRNRGNGRHSR